MVVCDSQEPPGIGCIRLFSAHSTPNHPVPVCPIPASPPMIYLDNAATSFPKPESVYQALDRFARTQLANPGRAGHRMAIAAERTLDDARHLLNQLLQRRGARALDLHAQLHRRPEHGHQGTSSPGDHVITTDLEHNSSAGRCGRWRRRA